MESNHLPLAYEASMQPLHFSAELRWKDSNLQMSVLETVALTVWRHRNMFSFLNLYKYYIIFLRDFQIFYFLIFSLNLLHWAGAVTQGADTYLQSCTLIAYEIVLLRRLLLRSPTIINLIN